MIHRRFTVQVVLRVALLLVTLSILAWIFGDRRLFFNQIILAAILSIQVAELIRYVTHTNRELSRFLNSIRHSDFAITFRNSGMGHAFRELEDSMSEIINTYKQVKIEKEAQFHFLQMLVSQLHVGIIALDKEEHITLINQTAQMLVGIPLLKNWKILRQENPGFVREIDQLGSDGRKLIEVRSPEHRLLSVDVRTLLILGKPARLITFQDINSEIEQKEIEAWHKLIRILTHEIMNSVTPIASLTETMQGMLQNKNGSQLTVSQLEDHTISDIRFSLDTIHKRSEGLLTFVENYRQLTRVPRPQIQTIDVSSFVDGIKTLMMNDLIRRQITLESYISPGLVLEADPVLLEQVLINLLTNSIHALDNTSGPMVTIRAHEEHSRTIIEVTDNGKGISPKEISEIFIPFFTTKKEGSGIGLSLSKQIMSLHKGSIRVASEAGVGTTFFLYFPQED